MFEEVSVDLGAFAEVTPEEHQDLMRMHGKQRHPSIRDVFRPLHPLLLAQGDRQNLEAQAAVKKRKAEAYQAAMASY